MTDLKIGDKVTITKYSNNEYIGKTGTLLSAQTIRPAISGQIIKEKACKVKLDDTGEIVDCVLSQLI